MADLRLFLAIELPDEARAKLADIQNRLKAGCRFVDAHPKWVDVANLHLTVIFLGSTDETRIPELTAILDAASLEESHFELSLSRIGLFPPESKNPMVLSADVTSSGKSLRNLHRKIHDVLGAAGYPMETRPYHPHLTLARLPSIKSAARLGPLVTSHASMLNIKFPVQEIVLFESRLSQTGPTYYALHRSPLSARNQT